MALGLFSPFNDAFISARVLFSTPFPLPSSICRNGLNTKATSTRLYLTHQSIGHFCLHAVT